MANLHYFITIFFVLSESILKVILLDHAALLKQYQAFNLN